MKITKITDAQAKRFPEWAEKYISLGLSTQPADFEKAKAAALRCYDLCKLKRPRIVLELGSPFAVSVGGVMTLGSQVRSQVWSQVRSQVESQVGSQVGSQVWSQVWSQVRSQVWSGFYNHRGGQFWASWIGYVSFLRDVLAWSDPTLENFALDEQLTASCGWVWWHKDVLAISDRPRILKRDEQNRLHCEDGPAIAYPDGWGVYAWHGVRVTPDIVEHPERIKLANIQQEANAEIRRVMLERYGLSRYLIDAGAKLIHSDEMGKLHRIELVSDEPLVMVELLNSTPEPDGSFKTYFLRVPPDMRMARQAVAWTFGMTTDEYAAALVAQT